MFHKDDMIVYGQLGICRVVAIDVPNFSEDSSRLYYTLDPLQQQGTVFVPVDSPVFMRPVMTREEAESIIDLIPSIRAETDTISNLQQRTQFYGEKLRSHRCEDLIALIASIYAKKQERSRSNRNIGSIDEATYAPLMLDLENAEGMIVKAEHPEKKEITATVTLTGTWTDDGFLVGGTTLAAVDKTMKIYTDHAVCEIIITGVSK